MHVINSDIQTLKFLWSLWIQLGKFVQDELMPQFVEVITGASKLRNCISQEARQFGGVSLSALDRRTVEE